MASIRSERLELVSLSPDFIDALLAERRSDAEAAATLTLPDEWPDAHDRGFLNFRLGVGDQLKHPVQFCKRLFFPHAHVCHELRIPCPAARQF